MGLFGKLFEKKVCDICGGDIGLLGNRKLEDGNMCKECAAKLSPWFSDRKESTIEEIRGQLAYREENKAAVEAFQITRTFGKNTKVYIDDNHGKFIVSASSNIRNSNPDVLDLASIAGCSFDVNENCTEKKQMVKGPDGKSRNESFDPPHYAYSYNFRMTINVNHPYFDHMSFILNNTSVTIETAGPIEMYRGEEFEPADGHRPQSPGMGGPQRQTPEMDGLQRRSPGMGGQKRQAPEMDGPQRRSPGMDGTQRRSPEMGGPQRQAPEMDGPQRRSPGMGGQKRQAPEMDGPQRRSPEMGGPQRQAPDMGMPHPQNHRAPMPPVGEEQLPDPRMLNPEYAEFFNMGNEIRDALLAAIS